jgi:hypothetical protein
LEGFVNRIGIWRISGESLHLKKILRSKFSYQSSFLCLPLELVFEEKGRQSFIAKVSEFLFFLKVVNIEKNIMALNIFDNLNNFLVEVSFENSKSRTYQVISPTFQL